MYNSLALTKEKILIEGTTVNILEIFAIVVNYLFRR